MNMKGPIVKVFRKFVSLIPEGMKARLKPFKNKITEVMRK